MAQHKNKGWQMRERIAQIAAEYLSETGSQDYQLAKNKAASQLGLGNTDATNLPSNKEIQQALIAYQRIFRADAQPLALVQHRQTALQAMRFFQQFNPRLVGSVLDGSADIQSAIYLHLFADTSEEVAVLLMDNDIPYDEEQKRFHIRNDDYEYIPGYSFLAENIAIHLSIFTLQGLHQAPLSTVDGKPMQRADYKAVSRLVTI